MKRTTNLLIATMLILVTACSVHVRKHEDDDSTDDSSSDWPLPTPLPPDADQPDPIYYRHIETRGDECTSHESTWYATHYGSYFRDTSHTCIENEDFKWRTSCPDSACAALRIYVHYMLAKELGTGLTVHIEAFDNEQFAGYPKGSVTIQDFHAATGEHREADLYLEPGEYFLRAFVSNEDDTAVPYPFAGMDLVAGEPMGIYGALSGAQKVIVAPGATIEPVHIKMDKLFEKPGSRPATQAYMRVVISTELHAQVTTGRKIYVEMFSTEDFERTADHRFEVVSDLLKIEGALGQTEFISPSLDIADYYVRVYLDSNGNGFADDTELAGTHMQGGLPRLVRITKDTIRSISIDLDLASQ